MIKWKLYWATLVAALLGVLFLKNRKMYADKTWKWQTSKSLIEGTLLVLSAVFMPVFLVVYGSTWITQGIKRPAIKVGVSCLVGTVLMLTVGSFLELLVLLGVFSIELISSDFLNYLHDSRTQRGIACIMDGRASYRPRS
jgi:hypothetical protein